MSPNGHSQAIRPGRTSFLTRTLPATLSCLLAASAAGLAFAQNAESTPPRGESSRSAARFPQTLGLNTADPGTPAGRLDVAVGLARESSQRALAALDDLAAEWQLSPPRIAGAAANPADVRRSAELERLLARARLQVWVEARDSTALSRALAGSEPTAQASSAAAADLALMQAQWAEIENRSSEAAERAGVALSYFRSACPPAASLRGEASNGGDAVAPLTATRLADYPECDYRAVWQAERILERRMMAGAVYSQVRASAQSRLALALAAGDQHRAAQTWSLLGFLAALSGDPDTEVDRLLLLARQSSERASDPELRIRILVNESAVASLRGDARTAIARTRSALALARSVGLQRVQPTLLNNLADAQLRLRQPRQALRTVQEALPLAERLGEVRVLYSLHNNSGLAHIALGQIEIGKRQMREAEALLGSEDSDEHVGQRVANLREFGDALAAAGDAAGALELYHRERALAARIRRQDLEAALREIQASFDAEVRQRDMALLQDQVATRDHELASQDLTLRIWLLLLALLGVLLLLGGLMYGRLRGRERLLSERRERLRRESEQDPLTGLGNRRGFEARMRLLPGHGPSPGALLLLDIDHFKRINDRYGHASGDAVLIEVARRIQSCLRRNDLVVRWGGEEFLIHTSGMDSKEALGLARRVLERLAAEPIEMANGSLRVTASLGLCMDRLPSCPVALGWEDRLRLADLALYAAKSRGRSRAVAVLDSVADGDTLRAPEIDFEAAERSGQLRVQSAVVSG